MKKKEKKNNKTDYKLKTEKLLRQIICYYCVLSFWIIFHLFVCIGKKRKKVCVTVARFLETVAKSFPYPGPRQEWNKFHSLLILL